MLHIILLILKIIGIILLILLGLLLAVLLLVLLVPVRYRVRGSYYGTLKGNAKVTWLLHMLSVTVSYGEVREGKTEEEPSAVAVCVRLFGFRLFRRKKHTEAEETFEEEDLVVQTMEVPEQELNPAKVRPEKTEQTSAAERQVKKAEQEPVTEYGVHKTESDVTSSKTGKEDQNGLKHKGPIGAFYDRICKTVRRVLLKLKFSYQRICDTLKQMKHKKEQLEELIANPDNQATARLIWRQIRKLFHHILPGKGKGKITFGFEDPYLTGQVLTYASVIYPFCHKQLELFPVFEEEIFEGEGYFKGRIGIGALLVIGGRLLLDKNVRLMIKKLLR